MAHDDDYEESPRRGRTNNKDLVLAPGEYAYVQEMTKGTIQVLVGPCNFAPTAQHQAVIYTMKSEKPFTPVARPDDAVQKAAIAVEGMYLQLLNPSVKGIESQPDAGHHSVTPTLDVGRKVNIPGPVMFSLWPGQTAKLIKGHTLRSNQYLLVRVYNEEQARANWSKAVIKKTTDENGDEVETTVSGEAPANLTVGRQLVIKGTEVSFYIPPTGVTVVTDDKGSYVREALTLERLEYCILVNEGGDKRYEKGPAVVFPEPNEKFITSPRGDKKFRAIELNPIQGIYVKVISDYEEDGKSFAAGEELFITGSDTPIYFPREEHSLIKYDNKTKHFATAIPAGEGRYSMDRLSGVISVVKGPAMELPDPRTKVFVHRRLTDRECALWYPGNTEALGYNQQLAAMEAAVTHTRGAISDGELKRAAKKLNKSGGNVYAASANSGEAFFADSAVLGNSAQSFMPDEFSRGSTYTQPRQVTLNTKYQGCPVVCPHTGYAVQVVSASGERRTELGPTRILVGYDETLEVLRLSRGKPKTTDNALETVYLRVKNNKISDVVVVETSDHVRVAFKLSFLADFEGDSSKWFEVENYVKLLCDHVRSLLAGAAKKGNIATLYGNAVDFVRDTVLGAKGDDGREGLFFAECGLRVRDVEVLQVAIQDADIARLLEQEQHAVVSENITLDRERRKLSFTTEHQSIQRKIQEENFETTRLANELAAKKAALELELVVARITNEVTTFEQRAKSFEAEAAAEAVRHSAELDRNRVATEQRLEFTSREQELRIAERFAQAEAILKQTEKFGPEFAAALTTLSTNETMEKIAKATSVQQLMGGKDAVDVLKQVFNGFPGLKDYMERRGLESLSIGVPANGVPKPTNGRSQS